MSDIHQTAIIADSAKIGNDVQIGPYSIIGANVTLGDGCALKSHVVIEGTTTIGKNCKFFPFTSIGQIPQDLKFKGEASFTEIGDNNVFREYVTVNSGTEGGGNITKIGNDCLFMTGVHIAHDCIIGSGVIMANLATLAGHVRIGDYAVIGGLAAVHQWVRIGSHAMIGGLSGIEKDVIPYGTAMGERAHLVGLNFVGLKRRGFSKEDINDLRHAFDSIFYSESKTFSEKLSNIEKEYENHKLVQEMLKFLYDESDRSILQPKL